MNKPLIVKPASPPPSDSSNTLGISTCLVERDAGSLSKRTWVLLKEFQQLVKTGWEPFRVFESVAITFEDMPTSLQWSPAGAVSRFVNVKALEVSTYGSVAQDATCHLGSEC